MMERLDSIVNSFDRHRNDVQAGQMSAYMKNKFEFLGIKKPLRAELSKPYLKDKFTRKKELIGLVNSLWDKTEREYQYVAIEFLYRNRTLLDLDSLPAIENLIVSKSWWDTVDALASRIVGDILLRSYEDIPRIVSPWIESDNLWLNRTAIIFQLKYKDKTQTEVLERSIQLYSKSKEFFHAKAIGWALRQYSKVNPTWVKEFIKNHDLQPLSVREGSKYL